MGLGIYFLTPEEIDSIVCDYYSPERWFVELVRKHHLTEQKRQVLHQLNLSQLKKKYSCLNSLEDEALISLLAKWNLAITHDLYVRTVGYRAISWGMALGKASFIFSGGEFIGGMLYPLMVPMIAATASFFAGLTNWAWLIALSAISVTPLGLAVSGAVVGILLVTIYAAGWLYSNSDKKIKENIGRQRLNRKHELQNDPHLVPELDADLPTRENTLAIQTGKYLAGVSSTDIDEAHFNDLAPLTAIATTYVDYPSTERDWIFSQASRAARGSPIGSPLTNRSLYSLQLDDVVSADSLYSPIRTRGRNQEEARIRAQNYELASENARHREIQEQLLRQVTALGTRVEMLTHHMSASCPELVRADATSSSLVGQAAPVMPRPLSTPAVYSVGTEGSSDPFPPDSFWAPDTRFGRRIAEPPAQPYVLPAQQFYLPSLISFD